MSQIAIRAALETALMTITPAVQTQFENVTFTPKTGVPYQSAYLIMNRTENPVVGDGFYRERGIFQVTLRYPIGTGSVAPMTQAEKIRTLFRRGASFNKDGITVMCDRTPDIRVLPNEVDRFVIVVKIYFYSNIFL